MSLLCIPLTDDDTLTHAYHPPVVKLPMWRHLIITGLVILYAVIPIDAGKGTVSLTADQEGGSLFSRFWVNLQASEPSTVAAVVPPQQQASSLQSTTSPAMKKAITNRAPSIHKANKKPAIVDYLTLKEQSAFVNQLRAGIVEFQKIYDADLLAEIDALWDRVPWSARFGKGDKSMLKAVATLKQELLDKFTISITTRLDINEKTAKLVALSNQDRIRREDMFRGLKLFHATQQQMSRYNATLPELRVLIKRYLRIIPTWTW